jgi:anti-sigma regulatory factor (Ser/Thr protein kinase)
MAVRLPLPRVPQSVAVVRRQVRDVMEQWCLLDLADEAELLTSELAANAVQHATGRRYTVAIGACSGLIVVAVFDSEPRMPVLRELDAERESGRGLATVAALARDWGAMRCLSGKCVWFTLQIPACVAAKHDGSVAGEGAAWHLRRAVGVGQLDRSGFQDA